ncbi:NUDIX hydrolase [Beutenbergia cavernae DSM 12333]|uniref:NUDIX hydrolase n=1 Tax=Beutenbergia cavernae (strain ATCC BAA-8 / DSM 12333 / CCUG 43141 / JCM 11478 / NBRC 16432 / NCIMB 13614 / HKI 0122) TaxID=471853 RepID=C5BYL4_BEUC1|nr:NUDIX domain-containing protein [Beutenbergia cavernae]ACQ78972.1 NUDIX hydrolase [Beutenbergia cavernae DSM 12333]
MSSPHPAAPSAPASSELVDRVVADLVAWAPADTGQAALRSQYLEFVAGSGAAAARRDGGPEHLTASCFVFSPDRRRVLLAFHRKARCWLQLGGHLEPGDASGLDAALREGREEGGIADLTPLVARPADLHRHTLVGAFGACRVHWDVGYAALAPADAVPHVSDESEDVAWWPLDDLPSGVPADLPQRIRLILAEVAV